MAHYLEYRRDPPHVDDPRAEELPRACEEEYEWQSAGHAQDEELRKEDGPEVDGEHGDAAQPEQPQRAAQAREHEAEAVRPGADLALGRLALLGTRLWRAVIVVGVRRGRGWVGHGRGRPLLLLAVVATVAGPPRPEKIKCHSCHVCVFK